LKNLKLTILKQQGFVGELMNVFGEGKNIRPLYGNSRWLQYTFPEVSLFTQTKMAPAYRLLNSFEENNGILATKMFHLYDDKTHSFSHVSFLCMRGIWIRQEYKNEIATSENLMEIL